MKKRGRVQSGCGTQRPHMGRPRAARAALLVPNRQRQGGGKRASSRCRDGAGAGKLSRHSDAVRSQGRWRAGAARQHHAIGWVDQVQVQVVGARGHARSKGAFEQNTDVGGSTRGGSSRTEQ